VHARHRPKGQVVTQAAGRRPNVTIFGTDMRISVHHRSVGSLSYLHIRDEQAAPHQPELLSSVFCVR